MDQGFANTIGRGGAWGESGQQGKSPVTRYGLYWLCPGRTGVSLP